MRAEAVRGDGHDGLWESLFFETGQAAPPADLTRDFFPGLPLPMLNRCVSLGASAVFSLRAEGFFLSRMLSVLARAGRMPGGEGEFLAGLMRDAYADMGRDPAYGKCGSAVPYFMAHRQQRRGHAFVYVPRGADARTRVLLLLNGFGGNLMYFPWAVKRELPGLICIAPSWGIRWDAGSEEARLAYLRDAMKAAESHLGFRLSKPWLLGLSQGGIAAYAFVPKMVDVLSGFVSLSACACIPAACAPIKGLPVRAIHGAEDPMIPLSAASETIEVLAGHDADVGMTVFKDAGHFLILSHREKMGETLRDILMH